jgi:hypothetical protein
MADAAQTIGLLLILAAAVGYLSLWLRRSAKRGGCCSCSEILCPTKKGEQRAEQPQGQAFVPSEDLADRARQVAQSHPSPGKTS